MKKDQKHTKHPPMARPAFGQFARNEWAILGTTCGEIKELAFHLTGQLSDQFQLGYVDADHKNTNAENEQESPPPNAIQQGAHTEYTDKISHHRFDTHSTLETYQYRTWFNDVDAVIVNGNHFRANRQIVVIDDRKRESLQRKVDRLTDVVAVLLTKPGQPIPDFVKEIITPQTPILQLDNRPAICAFLKKELQTATPPISGLVLVGGKSTRMGQDKGLIDYHHKPQREYLFDLLQPFCESTYISCRPDQVDAISSFPTLPDTFIGLGPFGALLSAFRQKPDNAWLVVACDYPLIDKTTIQQLVEQRNASKTATAYNNPDTGFPEPLITLWEPRSYIELFRFLAQGYSCPRKVLINTDVHLLDAPDPALLQNANHPQDKERIMNLLKQNR